MRVSGGASSHRTGSPALGPEDREKQTLVLVHAGISPPFLTAQELA